MSKKIIGVAACLMLLLFSAPSPAQVELKPAIGLTFAGVSKDPQGGDAKAQVGWQFGGTALFGKKLYGEIGAFYTKKVTEITFTTTKLSLSGVHGFRIPAMVGYHLLGSEKGLLGLRVFGGGALFLVTSVNGEGLSKDDLESPTYGVFAGAGLDLGIFFLDAKYEWSLTDVSSLRSVDIGKGRAFYPTAGIRLPF